MIEEVGELDARLLQFFGFRPIGCIGLAAKKDGRVLGFLGVDVLQGFQAWSNSMALMVMAFVLSRRCRFGLACR